MSLKANTDSDLYTQQNFLVWSGLQVFSYETRMLRWMAGKDS